MQAARKTPRIQKKAEMARGRLEEVMVQGHREEVMPQERQGIARRRLEMAWGRQEMAQERQGIARRRLEMARGRLAGCRRELPERMLTQRRQTGQPQEENGDMPGDATSDGTGSNGGGAPGGNGGMSGKSVTTLIPVSTVVHTTAGTETTFQRLAAGDLLKLLIETSEDGEEVIIEIWMQ